MDASTWFVVWFAVGMFLAALNPRMLGVVIAYSVGLLAVYPDMGKASILCALLIPAYLLSVFRD